MLCLIRIPNALVQLFNCFLDYSMERLVHMVNSDLADTLGNLLLRISSKRLIAGIADSASPAGLQYHQRDMFPLAGCSEELASAKDLELISQLHKLPGWFLN